MLSPSELSAAMVDQMSLELPKGKSIVDVFADFMRYLYDSTEALFKSSEPNVKWDSIPTIELVLTHPNGWKGPQQSQLRTAAVKAGLIQDTPAEHARVHFVSEGEASFSFCATHTQVGEDLKVCRTTSSQSCVFLTHWQPGEQALIIDAGGGTIDISTYKILKNGPLQVEELYEPQCESRPSMAGVLVQIVHSRLGPRRRACDSESNRDGQRCAQTLGSQADHSTGNQRS